jgi:hypothetical protein
MRAAIQSNDKGFRMRLAFAACVATALCAGSVSGADFDGSKPLICAPIQAMDCTSDEGCTKGTPEEIGAPAFLRIDVSKKSVAGSKRTSTIQQSDLDADQLLLRGTELGYGWTIAIDQTTGKAVITLTDHEGVFVLFGACTVP